MQSDEIEKMFNREIGDKKKIARGVYSRASRLGYTGKVRTQVDYLKGKEKKRYMGNGEVKIMNVYDNIENVPKKDEILKMTPEQAVPILNYIKKAYTIKQLKEYWELGSGSAVYTIFYKFKLMKRPLSAKQRHERDMKKAQLEQKKEEIQNTQVEIVESVVKENLFEISFKGVHDKNKIESRVLNILQTLENDEKYMVSFTIKEV